MSLEGKGQTYKRLPARPQITQQADGYGNELQLIMRATANGFVWVADWRVHWNESRAVREEISKATRGSCTR